MLSGRPRQARASEEGSNSRQNDPCRYQACDRKNMDNLSQGKTVRARAQDFVGQEEPTLAKEFSCLDENLVVTGSDSVCPMAEENPQQKSILREKGIDAVFNKPLTAMDSSAKPKKNKNGLEPGYPADIALSALYSK
ncbi:hypothetical protein PoB_003561300 [Plakobranchus ocellatus]|uniref:Uncharacterized protein n=1 Tax=Plakobranchus ocellatus TaxID=259542 RepID=A0AAV4AQL5_9GAST|nr:hypothetical protein PoB_003561300 [Plakobranchus ocellatus]